MFRIRLEVQICGSALDPTRVFRNQHAPALGMGLVENLDYYSIALSSTGAHRFEAHRCWCSVRLVHG